MDAATKRINSASWREKQYERSSFGNVGLGSKILRKSTRYNGSLGYKDTRYGGPGKAVYVKKRTTDMSAVKYLSAEHTNGPPVKLEQPFQVKSLQIISTDKTHQSNKISHCPRSLVVNQQPQLKVFSLANASQELKSLQFLNSSLVKSETQLNCAISLEEPIAQQYSPIVKSEHLYSASVVKSEEFSHSPNTSPGLPGDLENFQDLTEWCHKAPKTPNMFAQDEIDELNTPIIEFGDFLFQSPTTIDPIDSLLNVNNNAAGSPEFYHIPAADIQPTDKFSSVVDDQCQIFGDYDSTTDLFNHTNETTLCPQYSNVFINQNGGGENILNKTTKNLNTFTNTNSFNINTAGKTITADNVYTSLPVLKTPTTSSSNVCTGSVGQHNITDSMFTIAPVQPALVQFHLREKETSFDLQSAANCVNDITASLREENHSQNLRLDFSSILFENKNVPTIDTPEVINTALALDKEGFNLINFINNGNVIAEEIQPSSSLNVEIEEESSNDPDYDMSSEDSSDEDFEPAPKKKKTSVRTPVKHQKTSTSAKRESYDSGVSDISTVEPVRKRGRPPKRNISISSDSTADPEISRYRELRDKNNEASRRSRMNRKVKELHFEDEKQDLETKNTKLVARVQELERLVNSMRSNLMQLLLKK